MESSLSQDKASNIYLFFSLNMYCVSKQLVNKPYKANATLCLGIESTTAMAEQNIALTNASEELFCHLYSPLIYTEINNLQ
jgi:hypothetical protein